MKLTPEQIDRLYQFTRQHYVEYYDLQTELVDHLANAIEEQWAANPTVDFETALNIEFKKFGIFGFTDVVAQRKRELEKKYEKIAWSYLKEFFKLPIIIFTITSFLIIAFYLKEEKRIIVVNTLFAIFAMLLLYYWFTRIYKRYIRGIKNDKKWLFEQVLRKHNPLNWFGVFVFTSYYIPNFKVEHNLMMPHLIQSLVDSAFTVYFGLYIYIVLLLIPRKTQEYLKQTYPEYEFTK